MTDLVIVADDLTGAADSAALMTRRGRTSIVLEADGEWPADDVLAVDTDSRHRDPEVAAARVADATRRAVGLGAQVVKKIDSTLRGNVAAELRAMTDALAGSGERALLVVAPAFPATSRTTVGGVVHVDGERLSAHGSDGDVAGLLERGGIRTGQLGRDALAGADALAARFDEAHGRLDAVVVDSESDDDLATVVAASRRAAVPLLLVGSGGLTRPLAGPPRPLAGPPGPSYDETAHTAHDDPRGPSYQGADTRTPVLVVVGSYASASRAQRQRLVDSGLTPVLLDDDPARSVGELREALDHGDVVFSPDPEKPVDRSRAPQVAAAVAEAVTAVLASVGTLVATGGETARAVLTTAGVNRLEVIGEIEAGVVRGRVPELRLDVVTKAGAFGDADALVRCVASLQTIEEERTP